MNLYIDKRSYFLLQEIVSNHNTITGKELEKTYNISRKQLSYSMSKINDYLTTLNLEPIKRENTGHFIVPNSVIEKFIVEDNKEKDFYVFNDKERLYIILLMLFTRKKEISVNHFTSELKISKNTLLSDLKKVKEFLEKYSLYLLYTRKDGYFISGSEYIKRQAMIDTIKNILIIPKYEKIFFDIFNIDKELLASIQKDIESLENNLNIQFIEERIKELNYIIYAIFIRINLGKVLSELPDEFNHIFGTKEYLVLKDFMAKYNVYDERETLFLASQIQISKIYYLSTESLYKNYDLLNLSKKVIDNFEHLAGITFKYKKDLLQLLMQHCAPAFYRIKYNYHLENSIIDLILPQYIDLHRIVKKAIEPFEKLLGKTIKDEELVYITALFGAFLKKEGRLENVIFHKKAIVVCTNGVTISNYLLSNLKDIFPQIKFLDCLSIRAFKEYKKDYDIVFSTVKLKTEKPLFIVEPFVDDSSKEILKKRVLDEIEFKKFNDNQFNFIVDIIQQYGDLVSTDELIEKLKNVYIKNDVVEEIHKENKLSLKDLLKKDYINISSSVMDYKEAIEITSFPLLYTDKIYPRYVKKMIDIIEQEKPFIMIKEGIAIAHAGVDDGVKAPAIAMSVFPEKISFNGYMDIDILIVLATPDTKIHLNGFFQLIEILEQDELVEKIRNAKDLETICKIMNI